MSDLDGIQYSDCHELGHEHHGWDGRCSRIRQGERMSELKEAPKGQVYVCSACGKTFRDPYKVDVSCMLNRVLCYEDSLEYENGRVVKAKAVEEE